MDERGIFTSARTFGQISALGGKKKKKKEKKKKKKGEGKGKGEREGLAHVPTIQQVKVKNDALETSPYDTSLS